MYMYKRINFGKNTSGTYHCMYFYKIHKKKTCTVLYIVCFYFSQGIRSNDNLDKSNIRFSWWNPDVNNRDHIRFR